ncbi:hypothetical protein ATANTOWER_029994 [Ataeniobius toweri]|uniref:Uncharacterized protein n=1 Tax=Ataeniobius toweri TaxID=208326 RepID=A0ABU7A4A3_9TELE|nr:hypothetical protein [Ataeniobius toweri]
MADLAQIPNPFYTLPDRNQDLTNDQIKSDPFSPLCVLHSLMYCLSPPLFESALLSPFRFSFPSLSLPSSFPPLTLLLFVQPFPGNFSFTFLSDQPSPQTPLLSPPSSKLKLNSFPLCLMRIAKSP